VIKGDIEAAIAEVEALKAAGQPFSYQKVANKHNYKRSTLSCRCQGKTVSHEEYIDKRVRHLTNSQERALIDYINYLTDRNIPPTSHIVKTFAQDICGHEVNKNWVGRFLQRHPNELRSGYLKCIANERVKAEFLPNFILFFQLVSTILVL
jgi:hypothetical protein